MAIDDNKKKTPKRLNLKEGKHTRSSLCMLMRSYYNDGLSSTKFRDLVYSYSKLLEHDKHALETETTKRLDALERLIKGEGETVIDSKELNSPYAMDLKKKLIETEQLKRNLEDRLIEVERELKLIKSEAVNE